MVGSASESTTPSTDVPALLYLSLTCLVLRRLLFRSTGGGAAGTFERINMTSPKQGRGSSWKERIRRHPWMAAAAAGAAIVGAVVVAVWFQPQTLFFDRVVDEEFPPLSAEASATTELATTPADDDAPEEEVVDEPATDTTGPPEPTEPTGPVALSSGTFESRSRYKVTGTATVYQGGDGSRLLRLEKFSSTNGPDLFVYLTAADSADGDPELDADFVNLGVLAGNIGNQNYTIADDIDLDHYDTVVIWCRRFTVGFGAADLMPVG